MERLSPDIRYSHLEWNCPLSELSANTLLVNLDLDPSKELLDVGCGWGKLLIRAAQISGCTATGIDTNEAFLARGRAAAGRRNVSGVEFINMEARDWEKKQDCAMCIGSSHAFGGTREMLEDLAMVVPNGRVLVGDMCWDGPVSDECRDMFGSEVLPLKEILGQVRETGWKLLHLAVATQQEWDAFETGHRAGARAWLIENKMSELEEALEEDLTQREDAYFGVYRGQLQFVYAVLAR